MTGIALVSHIEYRCIIYSIGKSGHFVEENWSVNKEVKQVAHARMQRGGKGAKIRLPKKKIQERWGK